MTDDGWLMKKIALIIAALAGFAALSSCVKETSAPEDFSKSGVRTTLTVNIAPETRTGLGEKEGNAYPNYWTGDDKIFVNGTESTGLDASYEGKATANFDFEEVLSAPFNAICPSSAVDIFDETATVILPSRQTYVEGSYDPKAFIMAGRSEEPYIILHPMVSVFHLSLTGTASISRIALTGAEGDALSGYFTTDFTGLTAETVSNKVEMVADSPVALPAEFFICIPYGAYTKIKVEAFDSEGGVMTKTAKVNATLQAGQMYSAPSLEYSGSFDINPTVEAITSSTAVVTWSNSPDANYGLAVYKDSGCTQEQCSFTIPAGDACWSNSSPRFCVSGLEPGTTYYAKVSNIGKGVTSDPVAFKTEEFTVVEVSSTAAAVGDVILAEDFSELCWDCDMIGEGAGWFPTAAAQGTSFGTIDVDSYQAAATSNEKVLSTQTGCLAVSRLAHWAQGANANLYIHPGYVKLVGSSKVTHIVTPALTNIPEGKLATVEVELTASAYYSASTEAFATDKAVVAVQSGDLGEIVANATNTLDLESNIASVTLRKEVAWNKYKVTLNGVATGDRLAFGADKAITRNEARMNLSDLKVTIKQLYDAGTLTASLKGVSSSSAAFTWTHAGVAGYDVSKAYNVALYENEACTGKVLSLDIPADAGCWDGKIPCFVFGGLEPNTTYYFRVEDTTGGITSNVVAATTEDFTVVAYDEVTNPSAGDIILAENFSEWGYGADETMGAAGFIADDQTVRKFSGDVDMNTVTLVTASNTGRRLFHTTHLLDASNPLPRIAQWGFAGNSSVYLRAGYLRVTTTSSTNRTHIVTPKLLAIPDGKTATVEVTATILRTEPDNDFGVLVQTGTMSSNTGSGNPMPCYKLGSLNSSNTYTFPMTTAGGWETHTVTILGLTNENSLAIGSINNMASKNRFFLRDVTVKVTFISGDSGDETISDYTTLKAFLDKVAMGASNTNATVTADIALTAEQAASLPDPAPYDATFNGGSHSITGLAKPLFSTLSDDTVISDLTLGVDITSTAASLGAFAALGNKATIDNCVVNGEISFANLDVADMNIGGFIGSGECRISNSTNNASITIESGTISGGVCIGGILGYGNLCSFDKCRNTGDILVKISIGKDLQIGGICSGDIETAMDSCTNAGSIRFEGNIGSALYVGGVLGYTRNLAALTNLTNESTGTITCPDIKVKERMYVGGVVGGQRVDNVITHSKLKNYAEISLGDAGLETECGSSKWGAFIGGVAGGIDTKSTFTYCENYGYIYCRTKHRARVGGITSFAGAGLSNNTCKSDIRFVCTRGGNYKSEVGGIAGFAVGGTYTDLLYKGSLNTESSSPRAYTGGLVGRQNEEICTFKDCKLGGQVKGVGTSPYNTVAFVCCTYGSAHEINVDNLIVETGTKRRNTAVTSLSLNKNTSASVGVLCFGTTGETNTTDLDPASTSTTSTFSIGSID